MKRKYSYLLSYMNFSLLKSKNCELSGGHLHSVQMEGLKYNWQRTRHQGNIDYPCFLKRST